jgi:hypothetical protein
VAAGSRVVVIRCGVFRMCTVDHRRRGRSQQELVRSGEAIVVGTAAFEPLRRASPTDWPTASTVTVVLPGAAEPPPR